MDFSPQLWFPILGWPYEVSGTGEVRNTRTGRVLKQEDAKGYRRVTLCQNGKPKKVYVHHLVLLTFHGSRLGRDTRHLDGNPSNNRADNLRWGTKPENEADKVGHGTAQRRERNPFAKLTEEKVAQIRRTYDTDAYARWNRGFSKVTYGLIQELAKQHGVSEACIKFVVYGRTWK